MEEDTGLRGIGLVDKVGDKMDWSKDPPGMLMVDTKSSGSDLGHTELMVRGAGL